MLIALPHAVVFSSDLYSLLDPCDSTHCEAASLGVGLFRSLNLYHAADLSHAVVDAVVELAQNAPLLGVKAPIA